MPAAHLGRRHAGLLLTQNRDDLLLGKPALRITSVSSSDRRTLAQIGYSRGGKDPEGGSIACALVAYGTRTLA